MLLLWWLHDKWWLIYVFLSIYNMWCAAFMGRTKKEDKEENFKFFNSLLWHKKGKNMWILLEKLYRTYLGGTTRMCFIQFLEQDPHIFAYKYSVYRYVQCNWIKGIFMIWKGCLFTITKGINIWNNKFNKENEINWKEWPELTQNVLNLNETKKKHKFMVKRYGSCLDTMQNLFGWHYPNRFHLMCKHDLCTSTMVSQVK